MDDAGESCDSPCRRDAKIARLEACVAELKEIINLHQCSGKRQVVRFFKGAAQGLAPRPSASHAPPLAFDPLSTFVLLAQARLAR